MILFIATMIVKEVVQGMLDDDMIIQEKVGTIALYWIFPSQSYVLVFLIVTIHMQKRRKIETLTEDVEKKRSEKAELEEKVKTAQESKPESVFNDSITVYKIGKKRRVISPI